MWWLFIGSDVTGTRASAVSASPGQNAALSTGCRTHDTAQSGMTSPGSDLLDGIEPSVRQENFSSNMAHRAFLAVETKKEKSLVLHPDILYFTRKGEVDCVCVSVSVCVCVCVCVCVFMHACMCEGDRYNLSALDINTASPEFFKLLCHIWRIGSYNTTSTAEERLLEMWWFCFARRAKMDQQPSS